MSQLLTTDDSVSHPVLDNQGGPGVAACGPNDAVDDLGKGFVDVDCSHHPSDSVGRNSSRTVRDVRQSLGFVLSVNM